MYGLECSSPLGMEDGRIKDSQIKSTGVIKNRSPFGWQARLNRNIPHWGGGCPDVSGGKMTGKNYDQYIQIDLLNLTKITGIATQGRSYSNGREFAKDFKISCSKDGEMWSNYGENFQTEKVKLIWSKDFMDGSFYKNSIEYTLSLVKTL